MSTTYVVLRARDEEDTWVKCGEANGTDARAAVRELLKGQTGDGVNGEYVAVPARSWAPVLVALETAPRVVVRGG